MQRRLFLPIVLFATLLGLAACGTDSGITVTKDVPDATVADSALPDLAVDEQSFPELPAPCDGCGPDVPDLPGDPVDDFGYPCKSNSDCLSGLCILHQGEQICTRECMEECPDGFLCAQLAAGGGPDLLFVCQSLDPSQCLPCADNGECPAGPSSTAYCAVYPGEGSFCASACSEEHPCPEGYYCLQADTVEGEERNLCVLQKGACPCTQYAIYKDLSTPCLEENEFGLCVGERVCTEDGLTDCDAAAPSIEICNGMDDDCDGEIDEATCDDGNPCTTDECLPSSGCQFEALEGVECDDGDPCTVAEVCIAGECTGQLVNCDDQNPCTDDWCDPAGGCAHGNSNEECDDGDACTVGDHCSGGECAGTAVACDCQADADCAALEDGNVCNGTLFCDKGKVPYLCKLKPGTVKECPAPEGKNKHCLAAWCDPVDGSCSLVPANGGAPCDDGNKCTYGEVCADGACVQGKPLNCNDGNPCTDDSCQPGIGCVSTENDGPCDDGNPCTINDLCQQGECMGGGALSCNDNNACTNDVCNPLKGCLHTNNNQPCDDLDPCTEQDACSGGVCLGSVAKDCDDGNPCTNDTCVPLAGCSHSNNSNPCDDGNACTVADKCIGGICNPGKPLSCDDGNVCTDDWCNPAEGCAHSNSNNKCDDNNSCTTGDQCKDGVCVGTGDVDCDDGNPCTKDLCTANGGCQHQDITAPCNDGDPCTVGDVCGGGQCLPGKQVDCDDGNPCTADACNPETGLCTHSPADGDCDDGNPCTTVDSCQAGKCVGTTPPDCDDENVCTTDYCDPATGCAHKLNTAPCNDGDLCTTGDHCQLGECIGAGTLTCNDGNPCTDDSCEPESGCSFVANDVACDDGNACTDNDTCAMGWCAGTAVSCDDGNVCTDDWCNPAEGCAHDNSNKECNDGNACTVGDVCQDGACQPGTDALDCDDGNVCTDDACDPMGGCVHTANDADCSDKNPCTVGDYCQDKACQPGPDALDCSDGNVCTDDTCEADVGCVHTANAAACNDGNACTVGDFCQESACQPGPDSLNCDDGDACTTDTCDPDAGCQHSGGGCTTFSHAFAAGPTTGEACSKWNTFRSQLTGNYSKITIRGTYDMTGVSCTGGTANTICQALRNGQSGSWGCNGRTWRTGDCGGLIELNAEGSMCSCPDNAYIVRPCIDWPGYSNPNWGGAKTATCSGPAQTLEVICQ